MKRYCQTLELMDDPDMIRRYCDVHKHVWLEIMEGQKEVGILESTGTYTYDFQLVERNAEKKYAISSYSASKAPGVEISSAAFKLNSLTDNGNFITLGYAGGPLWATGNLKETSPFIADPLEAGDYYKWGYTPPYDVTGTSDEYDNYKADADFVDTATDKNDAWKMPTRVQFDYLISNTTTAWKTGWTNLGTTKGGRLITSKVNGISLFFAAAGYYYDGSLSHAGDSGIYWSSTPFDSYYAYYLDLPSGIISTYYDYRYFGYSVRPVQN